MKQEFKGSRPQSVSQAPQELHAETWRHNKCGTPRSVSISKAWNPTRTTPRLHFKLTNSCYVTVGVKWNSVCQGWSHSLILCSTGKSKQNITVQQSDTAPKTKGTNHITIVTMLQNGGPEFCNKDLSKQWGHCEGMIKYDSSGWNGWLVEPTDRDKKPVHPSRVADPNLACVSSTLQGLSLQP